MHIRYYILLLFLVPQFLNSQNTVRFTDSVNVEKLIEEGVSKMLSQNDNNGAINAFTLAIKLNPKSDLAYHLRGNAKSNLKNYTSLD